MKRILVWDLPVRLFHWLLAASFLGAFVIANVVDDESSLFVVHMLLGGVAAFMVLLRVLWGFVGSRYARFRSFAYGPREVAAYLRDTVRGGEKRHLGHNPGSSVAVWLMLALLLGLAFTGAFMSRGGEVFEEIHEVLAFAMIGVVAVHVAGIVWHTVRHRENIALSMVDGHREGEPAEAIPSSHALAGLAFLALTGLWAGGLVSNYDAATGTVTLPVLGQTLQLGEAEDGHGDEAEAEEEDDHEERGEHEEHEDDD